MDIPDWAFEEADKHFIPVQTEVTVAAVREVVAKAIMAATERAALVAETHMLGNKHVAAAIRQGSHSSNVIPHEGVVR
jgi:urease accessory protein UreE